jgi:DNA-binding MarR family transcriptional regulator
VRRLEELGFVVQTRSEEDTRRRHLALTAKGRQIDRRRKGTVEAAVRRTASAISARNSRRGRGDGPAGKNLAAE